MKTYKKLPKISVITVVYNDVENIGGTIKSVVNQTYKNFEYIVIDGNSDDGTVDVIKKYDKEITFWVSEKDKGIYDAMNKGIKKSKGDLLYFLNSNDFFFNNSVLQDIVKKYLGKDKPDILHGRLFFKYNDSLKRDTFSEKLIPEERLPNGSSLYHQAAFIKKQTFDVLGLYDTNYAIAGDYEFFCRCFVNNLSIVCIDNVITIFNCGGRGFNKEIGYKEVSEIAKKYFGLKGFLKVWYKRKIVRNFEETTRSILEKLGLKSLTKKLIKFRNKKNYSQRNRFGQ